MYDQFLVQAGITSDQAVIYEVLLKNGPLPAGEISKKTPLKRGLIYKVLDQLAEMGLVTKNDISGKATQFEPAHPIKLKELAEKREKEAKQAQSVLDGGLGQLISDFNLISGKPGVQFFEGLDGIKKTLEDSLTSKTEILSYADIEGIVKNIDAINSAYVRRREKLGLKKRGVILDTPFARKYLSDYHKEITQTRLIQCSDAKPFRSVMQIYDNKVSYITLVPGKMIGVIIEDQYLYEMHVYLFEHLWHSTPDSVI
ncbi:MAG: helix-turn-helix domain-containing protein [Patescibacteria group bacterium]